MNPDQWVTGGDGICRMRRVYEAVFIAAGSTPKVEECGAPATQPVVYRGEPHLVCVDGEGEYRAQSPAPLHQPETRRV